MIPIEQQMKLVALAGSVETPYDLVRYNIEARRMEVVVLPEPNPTPALVVITELTSGWGRLARSLVATSDN